jgi:hypothetical protein
VVVYVVGWTFTLKSSGIATADVQNAKQLKISFDTGVVDRTCCEQQVNECLVEVGGTGSDQVHVKMLQDRCNLGRILAGFKNEKRQDFRWTE